MILQTKYFDLETTLFSFKNPESIRQRLEEQYYIYFTDEPCNETITYNDQFKIYLKYKRTNDSLSINFDFLNEELLFPEVGCIEGYKITLTDYSCRGFKYELNHTYTIEEDPIPCKSGFHFCRELANCFNYYRPTEYIDQTSTITYNLDVFKFFKVKSNGTTYQLADKCCTNNITILDECSTEEILEAFNKWLDATYDCKVILRGKSYLLHDGIYHIPDEELDKQLTWYTHLKEN